MTRNWIATLVAVGMLMGAAASAAEERGAPVPIETEPFATLPDGVRYPEGIAANPATGAVYVGTFDFGPNANKLVRFGRSGRVEAVRDFGPTPLLGLELSADKVYLLNFGMSQLQRIAHDFNAATPVETVALIPSIGPPAPRTVGNPDGTNDTIVFGNGFPAPNAMVFDAAGNLFISASFQGAIFRVASARTCAVPCPVTLVKHDPLLATAGFPPFGANGLALGADGHTLFIAVTGDNRVLQMDLAAPGMPLTVFAESVHGADGLAFVNGRLWVAANQGDHVLALDGRGRPAYRAGSFEGFRPDGAPRGLLFPASLAVVDGWMYVANLSLPLTPTVGDEPEEDTRRWTVERFRLPN
jgi:hypothetical protein